ncbi:MAG TPA: restriction endonuclease subunit S, partial [Saprospiraceae bacterium]|nr:restriction endonuclease subunit S [Saprospiraceae bacterium]
NSDLEHQGWKIKKLRDISVNLDSKRVPITQNKRTRGNIPYFGASGIVDYVSEYLFDEDLLCVSEDGANLLARTYPIAFSISGKSWINNHAHVLRFESFITQKFVEIYLNSIKLDDYVSGMAQPKLNQAMLNKIPIPLPPLHEQQRIISILDEAFAAIAKAKANAEQNLKNAKELFESYLQEVFEKGKWEEKRLEEICVLISKGSSPKWQGIKYVAEPGVLFVTSENVGENTLLLEKRKYVEEKFNISDRKSILKNGDVLTNIVGASIGRTAIFDLEEIANINQAVCLIRCNETLLFNEYLMYLLNSPFTKQFLHDNEVNNARANLSLGFFRNLSIPLPELSNQIKVVEKIKAFHVETHKLETIYQNKMDALEELKKSILQKAFAGELSGDGLLKPKSEMQAM